MIFDSHAHYDDRRFDANRDEVLKYIFSEGRVSHVVNCASELRSCETSLALAHAYPGKIYAAAGVHPHAAHELAPDIVPGSFTLTGAGYTVSGAIQDKMQAVLDQLAEYFKDPLVRAVGEIGLDFHYDFSPRDIQRLWFRAQMQLASDLGVPVVVHDREAHGECMDMVRAYPKAKGVFHSFSGSAETALELVSRGWYASFNGICTFSNARKSIEAACAVPLDRLLVETDAPYLTPYPFRGEINNSSYIKYVIRKIAAERKMDENSLEEITAQNAKDLFGI